jgi:hypothetical protein
VSPAVRKVLACSSLDGDTDAGRVVDSLAPDVVIARLMRGTASSMRVSSLRMSCTICRISKAWDARALPFLLPFRAERQEIGCPSGELWSR